jgi:hypothetical protein
MSTPRPAALAKLVIGVFLKDRPLLAAVAEDLMRRFGPLDMVSPWFDFDFTSYYAQEMGAPLFRRLLVFQRLIGQSRLSGIKLETNAIETQHAVEHQRRANIDPGYLLAERFVLATGKNFSHRMYIGNGIYGDLTLIYTKGAFQPLPWTYPDYAAVSMRDYLRRVRCKYLRDLRASEAQGDD